MTGRYWELRPGTAWIHEYSGNDCTWKVFRHAIVWYRRRPGRKYTQ